MQSMAREGAEPRPGPSATPAAAADRRRVGGVLLYSGTTLGLMLVFGGLAALVAQGVVQLPVAPLALVTLGGLGPLPAAIGAAAYESGRPGVGALLARTLRWRVPLRWYAAALLGPAGAVAVAFLLSLALGSPLPPAPPAAVWQSLPLLAVVFVVLALIEEVGWRGYAQDRLQHPLGALWASLTVGVMWALWHLPQWWVPETGQAAKWSFAVFGAGTIAQSVGLAWLYNGARASILLVILAHAAINLAPEPWAAAWRLLPEGERGPYPSVLIAGVWVAAAVVLVALTEPRSLTRRRRSGPDPGSHDHSA
jgi:membrane protease YdiL (CAAX protease family)